MSRLFIIVGVQAAAMLVLGCSPLSHDDAKALLEAQLALDSATTCTWTATTHPSKDDPRRIDSALDQFGQHGHRTTCLDQLVAAGLVKRGECLLETPGGCQQRLVEPAGAAKFDDEGLTFPCGDLKLLELKKIKDIDGAIYVTFDRAFTKMYELDECKDTWLKIPGAGKQERQRTLKRKPEGGWSVSTSPAQQR